jgi:hypothetical protein
MPTPAYARASAPRRSTTGASEVVKTLALAEGQHPGPITEQSGNRSPAEGHPGQTWQPGEYYSDNKLARSNEQAYDDQLARQLWDQSAAMLSIKTV